MANNSKTSADQPGSFHLSWSNQMGYGTPRDVQFDGERKFYYAIGDTVDRESMTGIGAFELDLQHADLAEAKLVGQLLCGKNAQSDSLKTFEPSASFSVTCIEAGKNCNKIWINTADS